MNTLTLSHKTHKGKNILSNAGTNVWDILKEAKTVQFAKGEWIFIVPSGEIWQTSRHARWVRISEPDQNFHLTFDS